ncbi:hypothetical protein [Vibrio sp. LaRot3]|uniref:hypothetical protein n=1 Tax=Vibrio sp. LaRot3 TaxID=2998829 RepID=UPI0022CDE39C|nr:hypothetical protein [Vibrio sp. LaRot3]MDA0147412.1 hypothetical protein [Vibrio sp. LaRot3]
MKINWLSLGLLLITGQVLASSDLSGEYKRYRGDQLDEHGAVFDITRQPNGHYLISGSAVWVGNAQTGQVNIGDVYGEYPLKGNQIHFQNDECQFVMTFAGDEIIVTDDLVSCGGMNVTFNGTYKKNQ